MNTESTENQGRADVFDAAVELTPEMINQIYQEAALMRSEAVHTGLLRACRAMRSATAALWRLLFTSEARRHASGGAR